MPPTELDLNPVNHLTADAIGQPGSRVFYLQGRQNDQVVTLVVEKIQVQSLAAGIDEFLTELGQRYPQLGAPSGEYNEAAMRIQPPVDPLFRVGQLALAYDGDHDLAILIAHEIEADESGGEEEPKGSVVRFWCTRSQLLALARWGMEVASRGRPTCPYCGAPIGPEGHFCPKKNGHKH